MDLPFCKAQMFRFRFCEVAGRVHTACLPCALWLISMRRHSMRKSEDHHADLGVCKFFYHHLWRSSDHTVRSTWSSAIWKSFISIATDSKLKCSRILRFFDTTGLADLSETVLMTQSSRLKIFAIFVESKSIPTHYVLESFRVFADSIRLSCSFAFSLYVSITDTVRQF